MTVARITRLLLGQVLASEAYQQNVFTAKSRHNNPDLIFETSAEVRVVGLLAVSNPYDIVNKLRYGSRDLFFVTHPHLSALC